jgi:alpha-glucosidase
MSDSDFLWWRDGVIYQIYPRSFADSNGDGIGDLQGIIAHLDYLNDDATELTTRGSDRPAAAAIPSSLGIDAIWLSPIYPSPMNDFGYDVADYCDVDPLFGSLHDFDHLVSEAHRRGIRVIMDLVPNHTSHLHPWFIESRTRRQSPKRDWYIWRDQPNNWQARFGGSAWEWDEATRQYYLHLFLPQQPDLNWRNPQVREAIFDAARFWLDRGVDGFRLDVAHRLIKDEDFRDNPLRLGGIRAYDRQHHIYDMLRPEVHDIWKAFRQLLDEYPERMCVGEVSGSVQTIAGFYGNGDDELHLAFNFHLTHAPWRARAFHRAVADWELALPPGAWPCYALSNHDVRRHISRYGVGRFTEPRAKVAAALLLTLRGTPFLYYGEEIGMREVSIPRDEILDPPGRRYWPLYRGRDGCRTPMQWNDTPHAGFTTGTPWLRVGPDFPDVNVQAQKDDPDSLLSFYRRLIRLRRRTPALRRGSYRPLIERPVGALVFLRETAEQAILVGLNLSTQPTLVDLRRAPLPSGRWRVLLSSAADKAGELVTHRLSLEPYEAVFVEAE